jgi:hypothetical protein
MLSAASPRASNEKKEVDGQKVKPVKNESDEKENR